MTGIRHSGTGARVNRSPLILPPVENLWAAPMWHRLVAAATAGVIASSLGLLYTAIAAAELYGTRFFGLALGITLYVPMMLIATLAVGYPVLRIGAARKFSGAQLSAWTVVGSIPVVAVITITLGLPEALPLILSAVALTCLLASWLIRLCIGHLRLSVTLLIGALFLAVSGVLFLPR